MASIASGARDKGHDGSLHHRRGLLPEPGPRPLSPEVDELTAKTKALSLAGSLRWRQFMIKSGNVAIVLALLALVRLWRIADQKTVTWDEAHFGKFGSHYLKREYYFDVHPPLGKLLVALLGWMAGYRGDFDFGSGNSYGDEVNFVPMRVFNAVFGILVAPLAYKTALYMGYGQWACWFISLLVVFEFQSLTLSKFILLDLFLLFFTVATFYALVRVHDLRVRGAILTGEGYRWLAGLGVCVGCVCSVKWVGLFVTVLVGLYTIYDLLIRTYQVGSELYLEKVGGVARVAESDEKKSSLGYERVKTTPGLTPVRLELPIEPKHKVPPPVALRVPSFAKEPVSIRSYFTHWVVRVATLILIPMAIYLAAFKVHFVVLNRSGSGDGSTSTLNQLALHGNQVVLGPRDVMYGLMVTLRLQGLLPNLLHSHQSVYPEGSEMQQCTTYGYRDSNNDFFFEFPVADCVTGRVATMDGLAPEDYRVPLTEGSTVRIVHRETGRMLRANADHRGLMLKQHIEVAFHHSLDDQVLDLEADQLAIKLVDPAWFGDEWVVEIAEQVKSPLHPNENATVVHPVLTNLRFRHAELGCYLATTGVSYPGWGFGQGEVVCQYALMKRDKSTWWNVEDHTNDQVPTPDHYEPPKPQFFKEFMLLNYGMMALNNALVPDPDKFDRLALKWWQWPTLNVGLRMGLWGMSDRRYYLIGHPFITWFLTLCLGIFVLYSAVLLLRWQRQLLVGYGPFEARWNRYLVRGLLPFAGWFLNFWPFVVMGRVTYVHHYVPAQYFATLVAGFILDEAASLFGRTRPVVYLTAIAGVLGGYAYFYPLTQGMTGPTTNYRYLRLLDSWTV